MRELKFRAWDKAHKRMCHVIALNCYRNEDHIIKDFEGTYEPYMMKTEHLVLMQYTGLKDKNGVEIYEGDIDANGYVLAYVADVYESLGMDCGWYWQKGDFEKFRPLVCCENEEVCGNIYENEELL